MKFTNHGKINFPYPLINAHTHAPMIAFRWVAEDLTLDHWLQDVIWPLEKEKVDSQFVFEQTELAILEMKNNWIKAFADMYFFEDQIWQLAEKYQIYTVLWEAILDFPTPSAKNPEEALNITRWLINKYKNSKYVRVALSLHSIYAVSLDTFYKSKKFAQKHNIKVHIHLAETQKEYKDCIKQYWKTPTKYLDDIWLIDNNSILAHCVWLDDDDIDIIAKRWASVVHCPLSNLKLWSGIAKIVTMLKKWVNVCLWTDGAASSNRLDIWEAWKISALIQKWYNLDPTVLDTKTIIKMMTINWMKALWLDNIDGESIEKIDKLIEKENNFNYLYEYNVDQLKFM